MLHLDGHALVVRLERGRVHLGVRVRVRVRVRVGVRVRVSGQGQVRVRVRFTDAAAPLAMAAHVAGCCGAVGWRGGRSANHQPIASRIWVDGRW